MASCQYTQYLEIEFFPSKPLQFYDYEWNNFIANVGGLLGLLNLGYIYIRKVRFLNESKKSKRPSKAMCLTALKRWDETTSKYQEQ